MSYILEALKKAQAERQLGTAPTIHALPIHAAPDGGGARRPPLWIALGVGGVLAMAAAAVLIWRQPAPAPAPATAAVVVVAAPSAPPPAAVAQPAPAVVAQAPAPAPVSTAPAPAAVVPQPAERAQKPAPARAEPAKKAEPKPDPDDAVRPLRELPEAIQREVPALALGGYIYSKDPAERLLLIDKVLRHEGEQVAPGLTLEKLLPKAAVMNYKGYRYRIPY